LKLSPYFYADFPSAALETSSRLLTSFQSLP